MEKALDVGAVRQEAVLMYYDLKIFQNTHFVTLKFEDEKDVSEAADLVIRAAPPGTSIQIFARNRPKEWCIYDDVD